MRFQVFITLACPMIKHKKRKETSSWKPCCLSINCGFQDNDRMGGDFPLLGFLFLWRSWETPLRKGFNLQDKMAFNSPSAIACSLPHHGSNSHSAASWRSESLDFLVSKRPLVSTAFLVTNESRSCAVPRRPRNTRNPG